MSLGAMGDRVATKLRTLARSLELTNLHGLAHMSESPESQALLDEFYGLLDAAGSKLGIHTSLWAPDGRLGEHLFRLTGRRNMVLYVKVRTEPPPFWGLTANRLRLMRESKKPWAVVLLLKQPSYGFVFMPEEVEQQISVGAWRLASDGDY